MLEFTDKLSQRFNQASDKQIWSNADMIMWVRHSTDGFSIPKLSYVTVTTKMTLFISQVYSLTVMLSSHFEVSFSR